MLHPGPPVGNTIKDSPVITGRVLLACRSTRSNVQKPVHQSGEGRVLRRKELAGTTTVMCNAQSTATQPSAMESLGGVRPEIVAAIDAAMGKCLTETNLKLPGSSTHAYMGKVRDVYNVSGKVVMVTTDRLSAFDRELAAIPFKGAVLNQTSTWWLKETEHICPNALLDVPDPNVAIMKQCTVFPVEFVVRGYMTGSTDTSLWTHYNNGVRDYCGNHFPDGLRKNDKLPHNVITPTTKSAEHDEPIGPREIVADGLMTQKEWDEVSEKALAVFEFGQREAAKRGLLLVDTKYEFGKDAQGNILLVDEIHTPDSSRYWIADTYEQRHAAGLEPQNIDKEFIRLWFREHCDPYHDPVLPPAPPELVAELSRRYVLLYEKITGQQFEPPPPDISPRKRMEKNIKAALEKLK
eukprot:jgi/Botrbrau1/2187/Bobra.101_2s0020.1